MFCIFEKHTTKRDRIFYSGGDSKAVREKNINHGSNGTK